MANRFVKRHVAVTGLKIPCRWRLFDGTVVPASRAGRCSPKMRGMLNRKSLIHRSGNHATYLMPKFFDLRKRRILQRTVRSKATDRERGHTFLELILRFCCEFHRISSILAHASFLSKCASFSNRPEKHTRDHSNRLAEPSHPHKHQKCVPAPPRDRRTTARLTSQ